MLGAAATWSVGTRTHPHRLDEFAKKKSRGSSGDHHAIFDVVVDAQNDRSEDSGCPPARNFLLVSHTHPPSGTSQPPGHHKIEREKIVDVSFDP